MADMKPGVPWSVKGIEPQAREAAKDAARRAGLTLGQWLNQMILDQDADSAEGQVSNSSSSPPPHEFASRLDALNRRLDKLGDAPVSTQVPEEVPRNFHGAEAARDHKPSPLHDRLERTDAMLTSLQNEIREIDERINVATPAANAGVEALERALFEVVDHIELSDKRNADVLKTIQARLSDLAGRMQETSSHGEDRQSREAIVELEQRFGELARKVERARLDERNADHSAIEQKLSDLAAKVERARHNPAIDALEAKLNQVTSKLSVTERVMTPQTEFNQVKSELGKLRSEVVRTRESVKPAFVHAIEARLKTLDTELSGIRSDTASSRDVKDLGDRLEAMASRLNSSEEALRSVERMGSFEDRLNKIGEQLQHSLQDSEPHPQISALENRVNEISRHLAGAGGQDTAPAIAQLEIQINDIAARLGSAESRFQVLETIETRLSELFSSIEASRKEAIDAAEQAAAEAVRNLSPSPSQTGEIATSDALAALERGLAEVKNQAASAEKYNQETLEAIHDTLKRVIERVGKLELTASTPRDVPAGDPFNWAPGQSPAATAQIEAEAPGDDLDDFRLPPLPEAAYSDEERSDPAESAPPAAEDASSTAAQSSTGAETTDFSRAYDVPETSVSHNEDFIAAARQAARAAAEAQDGLDPAPQADSGNAGSAKSLIGRFRGRNKTLLFAAAAVFVAVGALSMSSALNSPDQQSATGSATSDTAQSHIIPPSADASIDAEPQLENNTVDISLFEDEQSTPSAIQQAEPIKLPPLEGSAVPPSGGDGDTSSEPNPVITIAPSGKPTRETVLSPSVAGSAAPADSDTPDTQSWDAMPAEVDPAAAPQPFSSPVTAMAVSVEPEPRPRLTDAPAKTPAAPVTPMEAAESGDAKAQFEIAARHADGRAGRKDPAAAAEWYQLAAAQGLAPAQYRLGALYEKGGGVPQDLSAARIWYQRAAEQGNVKAMHNLAVLLAGGQERAADYARAARWFLKAAEHGLADSQFNLAVLHERGLGIQRDPGAAYKWFAIAAAKGDAEAEKRMNALAGKLDPATLARANAAYQSWRAVPLNRAVNFVAPVQAADLPAPPKPASNPDTLVARAQQLLSELGYDPGPADGMAGPRTREAITAFERDRGLPETGVATPEVIEKLVSATAG